MHARRGLWLAMAMMVLVLLGAAPAGAANNAFFGTFTDDFSAPIAKERADLDRQSATGIGTIREHIFWDRVETARGYYDWRRLDQLVGDAADRGIRVLPVLVSPPKFYVTKPAGAVGEYPPDSPIPMGQFAMKLVQRYGPNGSFWCPTASTCRKPYNPITQWEVWNEPDYPAWWKNAPNAVEYAEMLHVVSLFIHAADPSAQVISGGLTRTAVTSGYLDLLLLAGGGASLDSVGFHPYEGTVAGVVEDLRAMRAKLDSYGLVTKGIDVTEYGWATAGRNRPWITTPACQAALLYAMTRRFGSLRIPLKLTGTVQFAWTDRPDNGLIWPNNAGLLYADGSAKPSLGVFTAAVNGAPVAAGYDVPTACPPELQAQG